MIQFVSVTEPEQSSHIGEDIMDKTIIILDTGNFLQAHIYVQEAQDRFCLRYGAAVANSYRGGGYGQKMILDTGNFTRAHIYVYRKDMIEFASVTEQQQPSPIGKDIMD